MTTKTTNKEQKYLVKFSDMPGYDYVFWATWTPPNEW